MKFIAASPSVPILLLWFLSFTAATPVTSVNVNKQLQDISVLIEYLPGTWRINDKEQYEVWSRDEDGHSLSGRGYTLTNETEVVSEYLSISFRENQWCYEAQVSGQNDGKPVPFYWKPSGKDTYVFENPSHDFPQRLTYEIKSANTMIVHVTDMEGKGFSLSMERE